MSSAGVRPERRPVRIRAALVVAAIVVVGIAVSAVLALEWRSEVLDGHRTSFHSRAADLTSALSSKLQANLELTRTVRAIATLEPNAGETRLLAWYRQVQGGTPVSPSTVATWIEAIPAAGLAAFRHETEADPAFRKWAAGMTHIVPSGHRAKYCLTRAIVGTTTSTKVYPPLLDYCAPTLPGIGRSPYAALIRTATDTGQFFVTSVPGIGGSLVAMGAPVYRRGAPLGSVTARRAALIGIIGTSFDAGALIRSVVSGHHGLTLALYHRNAGGPLAQIARGGVAPGTHPPAYSDRTPLSDNWVVVESRISNGAYSANEQALVVLAFGLLITALIALLYIVLSRSRQLAWGVVGQKTEELEYRALHDPLTGLPNRTLVLDRAEQMLGRARRLGVPVIALFVDIDGFKQINDRYGHQAGDAVLRQVGERLNSVLRGSDTVGRLGGDEFVMLVDPTDLDAAAELVAERILVVLREPIILPEPALSPVLITASIGIALGRPSSAEELLRDADLAMYKAKAWGKDGYVLFESQMQTAARDRIQLEMDLGDALAADQFFLVYQPVLSLDDDRVVGVEALLRWHHPTRGVIPPDQFIPIAEENALIVPIGGWVLEQACAQGADWSRRGYALNMSVNVSARQLERQEFAEELRRVLADSGLDPSMLTIELTETALMRNPEATEQLLIELKAIGVRIAVDDFGTGYSSLGYLRQFPVDSLKIDRTFINDFALSNRDHAMTHTLIQLGKALGLETLAEGVEDPEQARQLQAEGCNLAQGFLFAHPLTPDGLERYLQDQLLPAVTD